MIYFLSTCFLLPMINALVAVQIHRQSFYHPNSPCAFIQNSLLSNDASIQSCIWECQYKDDCQTAVYYHDNKTCSMFAELCTTGRIESSGNVRSSVICHRKNREPVITCPSTSTVNQRPEEETSTSHMITSTATGSADSISSKGTTMPTTTTVRSIVAITRVGDSIVGVYNTTAGGSTEGKNGMYSNGIQFPAQAIDNSTSTKYLNFGGTGGYYITADAPGVGTGFYVTPNISNASIAISLCFATGDDEPNRDPITVTLEGSNADALDDGSSWTFIYNGSTGISPTIDPGRMQYVPQQNFSNTIAYKSYRLLVTSQRGPEWAVQYSEAQIIGYV